ncbi:MAG: deoxynucleoside kinase [Thermodesulfobacteriota bacterium]
MSRGRYIVVEGPIAVGKTSLAKILAEEFDAELELDPAEHNEFLRPFYTAPERHALATQLRFLLLRLEQQARIAQRQAGNGGRAVVCDYLLAKDEIFARLTLGKPEYDLYRELARRVAQTVHPEPRRPDLVVYLEASSEVLQRRLRKRNRDYERRIAPEYLRSLAEAYRNQFHSYEDAPLLVVNSSMIDFLGNGDERVDLLREIRSVRKGVQHYIPLGSR